MLGKKISVRCRRTYILNMIEAAIPPMPKIKRILSCFYDCAAGLRV